MATTTKSRKPTKKSAAKTAPKKKTREPGKPVFLEGKPAKNRHFMLDRIIYQAALSRAEDENISLSDVVRAGIRTYAEGAPSEQEAAAALDLLPADTREVLKEVWTAGPSARINAYLAALADEGWPVRTIAESLVEVGAVESITRQAISLRVIRGRENPVEDLPEVPTLGPRRKIVSSMKAEAERKSPEDVHDMAFRVTDEDYEAAARRAKAEGAMMSAVIEEVLSGYAEGEFDVTVVDEDADK